MTNETKTASDQVGMLEPKTVEQKKDDAAALADHRAGRRRPRREAQHVITLTVSGQRVDVLRRKLADLFGDGVAINVTTVNRNPSRADRLADALSDLQSGQAAVAELAEELTEWRDGMPENLQESSKGEEVTTAADALEEAAQELENAIGELEGVEFPGMYS